MSLDFLDIAEKQLSDSVSSLNDRCLSDIIDNEAKAYALYTLEERAIPNMIDGFKPVHRFVMYRSLMMGRGNKEKYHKLASIAGGVADIGYHHGEGSAQDSGALLANTWNNNVPFLDGQGNFGSRLVQEAAASRYIFARVGQNFYDIYKDTEYAPKHEDIEHVPPRFYLPIIPTVLLNGIKGIATGFATDILPHSLESVKECTLAALNGTLDKEPQVSFPKFNGSVVCTEEGKYELRGTYEYVGRKSIKITEIPYKFDRATYVEKYLDKLEDDGFITYEDNCSKAGFGFIVKFKKDYVLGETDEERHEKIMKDFGLIERKSQNLTVIDENGKVKEYDRASDLIKDFVKIRKDYVQTRIDSKIVETQEAFELALAKVQFIKAVIDGDLILQKKTRAQLIKEIEGNTKWAPYADKLVSMNIYHITTDEARKLAEQAKVLKADHEYWKKTTAEAEYIKDIESL